MMSDLLRSLRCFNTSSCPTLSPCPKDHSCARRGGLAQRIALLLTLVLAVNTANAAIDVLPDQLVLKIEVNLKNGILGEGRRIKEDRTLVLSRYAIRSAAFTLHHWQNGTFRLLNAPAARTYRGYCREEPNERVCAVIYPNGRVDACGTTGFNWIWEIDQPVDVSEHIKGTPGIQAGRDRWPGGMLVQRDKAPGPLSNLPPTGRSVKRAQVMADITDTCVAQERTGGGWEAALAWTDWHGIIADEMYTRNIAVSLEFTGALIRMSPYYELPENKGNGLGRLSIFWKPFYEKGGFDYVTGFTRQYDGGLAGVSAPYSYGVFWHEVGHNLGLNHEIYGVDMQNPMCWARSLHRLESQRQYDRFDDTKTNEKHEPVHPRSNPDVVVTTMDTPVTLRVLANDFDGNGEPIELSFFTEMTRRGARVVKTVHAESTGLKLDDLLYTPVKGFTGKDAVIYTVKNKSGLYASEVVHIYVLDPQSEYAAQWPMDRIETDRSPDLQKNQRPAVLPPGTTVLSGVIRGAVEIPESSRILLGDCDILPERPKDARPVGEFGKSSWYPLEAEVGNDFDPLNQSYTLSFWFRRTGSSDDKSTLNSQEQKPEPEVSRGVLVEKQNNNYDESAAGFRVKATSEGLVLHINEFCAEADRGLHKITHQNSWKPGQWHHVAIVVDRNGEPDARLYLDGVPSKDKISLIKGAFIFSGRSDMQLCSSGKSKTAFDEVSIAYRALNASQITALYDQGALRAKVL